MKNYLTLIVLQFLLTAGAVLSPWTGDSCAQDIVEDYAAYRKKTVFFDDFLSNNNNWPVSEGQLGRLTVGPETFIIDHQTTEGTFISLQNFPLGQSSDYILETEFKKISGVNDYGFGIAWGASDTNINDYFQFIVSGDGHFLISKWLNGRETIFVPWTKSRYLNQGNGSVNRLALVEVGNVIRFYINDNYVIQVNAGQFLGSRFGLLVQNIQKVAFDYVQVSLLPKREGSGGDVGEQIHRTYRQRTVWYDDFSTNPHNWVVTDDHYAHLTVGPEAYIVKHKVGGANITWQKFPLSESSDFLIETETRKVSGVNNSGFGIVWGASDSNVNDRYQFVISGDGSYAVTKLQNGTLYKLIPWTRSRYISQGTGSVNRLALVKEGGLIRFYINDNYVDQMNAKPFLGSRFGFIVEEIQVIAFDYLQISTVKRINGRIFETLPEKTIEEPLLAGSEAPTLTAVALPKSERRLALVIGNSEYAHGGSLTNPVNDARSMKTALEGVGFMVHKHENCTQKEMKRAMDDFGNALGAGSVGLFFYAGHGVQVHGNNYLIPVDARLDNENDVEYDTVRADRVLAKMESAGSKTNIVILDACRDNPFERSWRRGVAGNGLAFMNAPSGSIIAYATSPGKTASDGTGGNGLYTSAILKHINTPGITIEQMFKRVRATIMDQSEEKQVPWESTSLRGNFYFRKGN